MPGAPCSGSSPGASGWWLWARPVAGDARRPMLDGRCPMPDGRWPVPDARSFVLGGADTPRRYAGGVDTLGIIRQIESDPALRAQLRSVLLGDEVVELPALVRQLDHSMEALAEAQRATATTLAAFQASTDRRLGTLETKVTTLDVDVASLKGKSLENRLTLRPRQYVPRQLARGARLADDDRIDRFLDQLDDAEAADVERADAVVEARQADGTPVVFVVEASWVAHADDVERAERRARTLRQAGAPAVGLVVSHSDPAPPVLDSAARHGVAVVSESGGLLTNTTP